MDWHVRKTGELQAAHLAMRQQQVKLDGFLLEGNPKWARVLSWAVRLAHQRS